MNVTGCDFQGQDIKEISVSALVSRFLIMGAASSHAMGMFMRHSGATTGKKTSLLTRRKQNKTKENLEINLFEDCSPCQHLTAISRESLSQLPNYITAKLLSHKKCEIKKSLLLFQVGKLFSDKLGSNGYVIQ